jgi:GNAT superfamily N-acetyltransferase
MERSICREFRRPPRRQQTSERASASGGKCLFRWNELEGPSVQVCGPLVDIALSTSGVCADAAIVACVYLQNGASGVYIGMLATEPVRQALGLGKQMLLHAEEYAKAHFDARAFRMSVLSSRPELIAFYERRGYVRKGDVEDFPVSAGVGVPLVDGLQLETLVKTVA